MLDFIIYVAIAFLFFFSYLGIASSKAFFTILGTVFSIIIGIGLFTSGWQTYSVPSFTITDAGTNITVSSTAMQILPQINGSAEQQIIFSLATFFVLMSLIFLGLAMAQRRQAKVSAAPVMGE